MKKKLTLGNVLAALVNNRVLNANEFPTDPTTPIPIMDCMLTAYSAYENHGDQINYWVEYLQDGLQVPQWILDEAAVDGPVCIDAYLSEPTRIVYWALGLLLCQDAVIGCGLANVAIAQIKSVASQEFVYKSDPAICAVFTALADNFRTHIDPGVYARGLSILETAAVAKTA